MIATLKATVFVILTALVAIGMWMFITAFYIFLAPFEAALKVAKTIKDATNELDSKADKEII